jgi:hypothetical protein
MGKYKGIEIKKKRDGKCTITWYNESLICERSKMEKTFINEEFAKKYIDTNNIKNLGEVIYDQNGSKGIVPEMIKQQWIVNGKERRIWVNAVNKMKVGDKFGLFTIKKEIDPINSEDRDANWYTRTFLCECECGKTTIVTGKELYEGKVYSCGCSKKPRNKTVKQKPPSFYELPKELISEQK